MSYAEDKAVNPSVTLIARQGIIADDQKDGSERIVTMAISASMTIGPSAKYLKENSAITAKLSENTSSIDRKSR